MRISLETENYAEAVRLAEEKRGKVTDKTKSLWAVEVENYVEEKLKSEDFSQSTAVTVKYALKNFKEWRECESTDEVNPDDLAKYYEEKRKRKKRKNQTNEEYDQENKDKCAEATIQGYVSKVAAFLKWAEIKTDNVDFRGEPATRDRVINKLKIVEMIENCERDDVIFILFAGFFAGMRKDEIIMARPDWFNFDANEIRIPAEEDGWSPKSGRKRKIPLAGDFSEWLREDSTLLAPGGKYVLHPEASGERYRWDFRRPFNEYLETQGVKFSPHCMRHTFISHLARAGTPIAQVSEWSGDRIKTLERHYIHSDTDAEQIKKVFGSVSLPGETAVSRWTKEVAGPGWVYPSIRRTKTKHTQT